MTAKSSRYIPFISIGIMCFMVCSVGIPEDSPFYSITAIGNAVIENPAILTPFIGTALAGVTKSAVTKATAMRSMIPKDVEEAVAARVRDVIAPPPPTRTPADIEAEVDARVRAELRRRGVVDPNGKPEGGF